MRAAQKIILNYQHALRVGCPHYDSLGRMDDAMEAVIREIAGEESPVAHVTPGFMAQLRKL